MSKDGTAVFLLFPVRETKVQVEQPPVPTREFLAATQSRVQGILDWVETRTALKPAAEVVYSCEQLSFVCDLTRIVLRW